MIQAKIVGDSLSPQGHRLSTKSITFPRIILSELNTHRMLTKNSASSRAVPFKKMVRTVLLNPFIPIAFQKEHTGMQGTEYFSDTEIFKFTDAMNVIIETFNLEDEKDEKYRQELHKIVNKMQLAFMGEFTLKEWWLIFRDMAVMSAMLMYGFKATKQLANRLLEPFMWTTVLISGTEWENFFNLRCPQYVVTEPQLPGEIFRSKKDARRFLNSGQDLPENKGFNIDKEGWLLCNKGQAEIHMMALAEAMWDAMNESKPKQLQAGEWHIPFEDKMDYNEVYKIALDKNPNMTEIKVMLSTAMAARTSYTVVGDEKEVSYETLIGIHDKLINSRPLHASPMEHCSQVPTEDEYNNADSKTYSSKIEHGWFRNYHGFKQYRQILEESSFL